MMARMYVFSFSEISVHVTHIITTAAPAPASEGSMLTFQMGSRSQLRVSMATKNSAMAATATMAMVNSSLVRYGACSSVLLILSAFISRIMALPTLHLHTVGSSGRPLTRTVPGCAQDG